MSDIYSSASGSLKLKKSAKVNKKSSGSKSKKLKKSLEKVSSESEFLDPSSRNIIEKQTKAELAFEKAREKKLVEQIVERASKSHKERIMDFNRHLDTLTEHFDIPKVSWTK